MALEEITASHGIWNLVVTNPAGDDEVGQGDDHIRNIKKALKQTFLNVSATISANVAELNFAHKGGTVSGSVVVLGNIDVLGSITVSATSVFKTGLSVQRELSVGGATNLNSSLSVEGVVYAKNGIQAPSTSSFAYARIGTLVNLGATATASATTTDGNTPTWALMTAVSPWGATTDNNNPKYYKDNTGRVWLSGALTIPSGATLVIATLPAGYRPPTTIFMASPEIGRTVSGMAKNCTIAMDSSGTIRTGAYLAVSDLSVGGAVRFDGCSFQTV